MKQLLIILLTLVSIIGFGQVKNYTIHGTKWVRTDSMLIVRGDTVNTVTTGDTLLTIEQWRTLSSAIKSGPDSSRFNINDGYIYHYIGASAYDSTDMDGRYRPYNDSLFNCAIGEFPITSKVINVNYGSVSFGDSSYHLILSATYNTTDNGDIIPVQMSIHNPVKTPIGFSCEVDSVIGTFTYLAADSTGLSAYSGGASEIDPIYAADSSKIVQFSDTISDNGIVTKYYYATNTPIPPAGGYANNLYFDTLTSIVVPAYMTLTYTPSLNTYSQEMTVSSSEGDKLIATFIYPSGVGETLYPSGLWSFNFYGLINSASGTTQIGIQYFKRSIADVETNLFTVWSSDVNDLTNNWIAFNTTQPSFTVAETDKMGARLLIKTTSVTDRTITISIGDGYGAFLNTPNRIRHSQLRDWNGDSNYLHVTSTEKSTWNAKQDALTNPVTVPNIGAAGYLAAFSGGTTIDTILWRVAGSKLGRGIIPTSILHIAGDGQTAPMVTITNDVNAVNDSSFNILSDGRVEIGYTLALPHIYKLEVSGVTYADNFISGAYSYGGNGMSYSGARGSIGASSFGYGGGDIWDIKAGTSTTTGGIIRLFIDDVEMMRVHDNGNVGINTTAPDKKLEINQPTAGAAIRIAYNDANGSAADYFDLGVEADGDGTLSTATGDSIKIDRIVKVSNDLIYDVRHGYYEYNPDYTPAVTQNVYTKITPTFTTIENSNLTFAGDTITIINPGDYVYFYTFTLTDGVNSDFTIQLRKNNVTVKTVRHSAAGTGEYNTILLMYYLKSLVAGDDLSLYVTNTFSSDDPVFSDQSIYIRKEH